MQILPFQLTSSSGSSSIQQETASSGAGVLFEDIFGRLTASSMANSDMDTGEGSRRIRRAGILSQKINTDEESSSTGTVGALRKQMDATGSGYHMVSLENLEMTREDFTSLKSALKKYGLSNDDIEEMENKVAAGGLTWSGFLSLVGQKTGISQQNLLPSMDNEQQRLLQGFFQKLGFQPDAAEELVTDLKQGRLGKVWDAVSGRLSTMKSEELVSVDSDELATLSKAMKLPQATADRLAETFGSLRRDGLSADELKAALAAVRQQVQQAEDQITLETANLAQDIGKVLGQAVNRSQSQTGADKRDSKGVLALKELIEDKAEQNGRRSLHDDNDPAGLAALRQRATEESKGSVPSGGKEASAVSKEGHPTRSGEAEATEAEAKRSPFHAAQDRQNGSLGEKQGGGSHTDLSSKGSSEEKRTLSDPTRLIESKLDQALGVQAVSTQPIAGHADAQATTQTTLSSRTVLAQIENGMLQNLGQGRRELTLQLDPPELGKVMLVLQVRDKEVSAVLRTESQESGRQITEQLQQLRQSLEQQGLKVERLEVQTQLAQQQNGSPWQGSQQHNLTRDWETFARQQSAMRLLRDQAPSVVQEMQSAPQGVKISQERLHVIA